MNMLPPKTVYLSNELLMPGARLLIHPTVVNIKIAY